MNKIGLTLFILSILFFVGCSGKTPQKREVSSKDREYRSEKILIITDIDDTIKDTFVLNKVRRLSRGLKNRPFAALNTLYYLALCQGIENKKAYEWCLQGNSPYQKGKHIFYVTGAPKKITNKFLLRKINLQTVSKQFLRVNSFPHGGFFGRPHQKDDTHHFKTKAIKKIMEAFPQHKVVLVGDNGEHDPLAYKDIKEMYPNRVLGIFIHALYDTRKEQHQWPGGGDPYFTAADLAYHFLKLDLISKEGFNRVHSEVLAVLKSDPKKIIAPWSYCQNYFDQGLWPVSPSTNFSPAEIKKLNQLKTAIQSNSRCERR